MKVLVCVLVLLAAPFIAMADDYPLDLCDTANLKIRYVVDDLEGCCKKFKILPGGTLRCKVPLYGDVIDIQPPYTIIPLDDEEL